MSPGNPPQQQQRQGQGRRKNVSRYGTQLKEKQMLKQMFGVREEQLKRYYREATRVRGETGPHLISLLERRLDNMVFRAGFASTRPQARQMTTHGLFTVNARRVDVPSYSLKPGDVVSIKESKRSKSHFTNLTKKLQNVHTPSWITLDVTNYGFRVTAVPDSDEANVGVDIRAIVELFAR